MLLDVETTADEGNGSDDGELSAPEGLDEGEEEALQSSRVELERDEEQVTSNKRRRREKRCVRLDPSQVHRRTSPGRMPLALLSESEPTEVLSDPC